MSNNNQNPGSDPNSWGSGSGESSPWSDQGSSQQSQWQSQPSAADAWSQPSASTQPSAPESWNQQSASQQSANQSWGQSSDTNGWNQALASSDGTGGWNQGASQGQGYGAGQGYEAGQGFGAGQGYQPTAYSPYGEYGAMAPQQDDRSGALGLASIILSLLALVIGIVLSILGGLAGAKLYDAVPQGASPDGQNLPPAAEEAAATMGVSMFAMLLPSVMGLTALILGIIGAQRYKNRVVAIWGLILAAAAPIICAIVWGVIALPHVHA